MVCGHTHGQHTVSFPPSSPPSLCLKFLQDYVITWLKFALELQLKKHWKRMIYFESKYLIKISKKKYKILLIFRLTISHSLRSHPRPFYIIFPPSSPPSLCPFPRFCYNFIKICPITTIKKVLEVYDIFWIQLFE